MTEKDSSKRIRVALVGCGRISKRHAGLLGEGHIRGAELAGVCDVDRVRARETGDRHGVPWCANMDVLVEEVRPDLISLLTPSGDHADHIMRLAKYGIPILCEKPLTLRLAGLDACLLACDRHETVLGEVKQNRYNVAVLQLKRVLIEGRLGNLRLASVRVWWSRDQDYYQDWHGTWDDAGGVLANQAIHHIDLLQWLAGPVKRVSAFATYSDYTEVETGLVASLEFESGCIGTVEATTLAASNLEGSLAVIGDEGSVELGGFAVNEISAWDVGGSRKPAASENPPDVYGFGHKALYEDVVRRLRAGQPFPVDGAEARKALEIVHAMYQSMETGRVVELDGDYPASRLGQ